eukprot:s880_g8.t1
MAEGAADNDTWRQEAVRMQKDDPELTTAQIAEKLNRPVKTVKNALANARKKGELVQSEKGSGGYSKDRRESPVQPPVKELPCRISPIPGKGLGLIATRQISRGELIVEESPVHGIQPNPEDQLEASVQDQIMDLHDKNVPDGNGKTLLGVFTTNALPQGSALAMQHSVL